LIDPFNGRWVLLPDQSRLSTPPQHWVQHVVASQERIAVREEIVSADGTRGDVSVDAAFDGEPYPVRGSTIADSIAYWRVSDRAIEGMGFRDGALVLEETTVVSPAGDQLTYTYRIVSGGRELGSGTAVFARADG
jgi:hypothetical protein